MDVNPAFIVYDKLDNLDIDANVPDIPFSRASCDSVCNVWVSRLLDLCKAAKLKIANIRLCNDYGKGSYTFRKCTLIDHLLSNEEQRVLVCCFDSTKLIK